MLKAVALRKQGSTARPLKVRVRLVATLPTTAGSVTISDVLLQPGAIATGWVPHVTEMPWMAGVIGG